MRGLRRRPDPAPVGEGLRAAILELYRLYSPPPPHTVARRVWWSTLLRGLGAVLRELDRRSPGPPRPRPP